MNFINLNNEFLNYFFFVIDDIPICKPIVKFHKNKILGLRQWRRGPFSLRVKKKKKSCDRALGLGLCPVFTLLFQLMISMGIYLLARTDEQYHNVFDA